jgi:hypothetical protein
MFRAACAELGRLLIYEAVRVCLPACLSCPDERWAREAGLASAWVARLPLRETVSCKVKRPNVLDSVWC